MNKSDVIKATARTMGISEAQVAPLVDTFLEILKLSLAAGEAVNLRGFGTFAPKELPAISRQLNGHTVEAPERLTVSFAPSGKLRKRVNGARTG